MTGDSSGRGDGSSGPEYVGKTLRTTLFVTLFVVWALAAYKVNWAILPTLTGVSLASLLLWGWNRFIRTVFSPQSVTEAREKRRDKRWAIVVFALVKYQMVGLLMWFLVQSWNQNQMIAFIGGFILLHIVIVLRALGSGFRQDTKSKE